MNLDVNMTVNLNRANIEEIITEYLNRKFPNLDVQGFTFNLATDYYDDRYGNSVKSFSGCDVKLKTDKKK